MTDMKEKRHRKPAAHETTGQENSAYEPRNGPDNTAQGKTLDGMEVAAGSEEAQEPW